MEVKTNVVHIEISGGVQIGKTAILQSIKRLLEGHNYCVAVPDREERHNPGEPIETAARHEKPRPDETVIVLTEHCN